MPQPELRYGVFNEDTLCLTEQPADEDFTSLEEAFKCAGEMIEDGVSRVGIYKVRYNLNHDGWYLVANSLGDGISVDARYFEMIGEEE